MPGCLMRSNKRAPRHDAYVGASIREEFEYHFAGAARYIIVEAPQQRHTCHACDISLIDYDRAALTLRQHYAISQRLMAISALTSRH